MPGHAVAIMVVAPERIPLIRDPKKPAPVYWKIPGGRSEGEETAEEVALRELEEEIGISMDELRLVYQENRGNHVFSLFRLDLPRLPQLKEHGDEGEEIKIFTPQEILLRGDFFPPHLKIAGPYLLALTM